MIEQVLLHPYDLPLQRPWRSAKTRFSRRSGLLVQLCSASLCGYGDCAPLPAAGTESLEAAQRALVDLQSRLPGLAPDTMLQDIGLDLGDVPATRFALECAALDLVSRREHSSLRRLLSPHAKDRVPVNAMLGPLAAVTIAQTCALYDQGFKILKIKVGARDPELDRKQLAALASELPPDVGLRLDANGAWSLEQAKAMVDALAPLPIECLEEPLQAPTSARLAELQSRVPFPLARDESLHGERALQDPASLGVRRLVLKPAAIGGLRRTLDLAAAATAVGIEIAVTGVVDSAAGLWATAQLAAATGSSIPHGLATATWLAQDLGQPPLPRDGFIQMAMSAGSGFEPTR